MVTIEAHAQLLEAVSVNSSGASSKGKWKKTEYGSMTVDQNSARKMDHLEMRKKRKSIRSSCLHIL